MRILIVVPRQPQATGNLVTAKRYEQELRVRGHAVQLVETSENDPAPLLRALDDFRPELVHLLHAYRTGRPWLDGGAATKAPCVVTLTGTDINQGIESAEEGPTIREVLHRAGAVITQNRLTAVELRRRPVAWADKIRYVPPATTLGTDPCPLRSIHGIPPRAVLFLHPAGLRRVKGNLELLRLFDGVAPRRPECILAFCGPALDAEYARRFFAALAERPWARYLGVIRASAMSAALAEADVILNHSLNEGLPNALVEAATLGRPILARNIPGNAAVVEPGENGLLYRDEAEFTRHALALVDDPRLRHRLSRPQPQRYAADAEAAALEAIYRQILAAAEG